MRRIAAILLVAVLMTPATAQGQWGSVWAGGGLAMPTGDAADRLEMGWLGTTGIGWNITSVKGLVAQAELNLGSNSWKVGSGKTTMTTILGNLLYNIGEADNQPYIYGGVGSMMAKPEGGSSTSEMAWQLGAGYSWKVNDKVSFWVDAKYLSAGDDDLKTTLMPITAGLSWSLGAKKP